MCVDGVSTAGLPDHRRSLSQSVPSRAIAAANREVMEATRETGGQRKTEAWAVQEVPYIGAGGFRTPRLPASESHVPCIHIILFYLCLSERL